MKIAVVGANGRSGKAFVDAALKAGHTVRAGVYSYNNFVATHTLEVMQCDATSELDVTHLIQGQDVVVSFIGHVKGSSATVQTDAMKVLVRVLEQAGPKRIVSLTGTGVRFPGDRISFIDYVLNFAVRFIDPARVSDGITHAEVLKNSKLDWTIIRVLKLEDINPSAFTLTEHGPTKWYVSRTVVAKAVLEVLEQDSFIQKAPIISKKV